MGSSCNASSSITAAMSTITGKIGTSAAIKPGSAPTSIEIAGVKSLNAGISASPIVSITGFSSSTSSSMTGPSSSPMEIPTSVTKSPRMPSCALNVCSCLFATSSVVPPALMRLPSNSRSAPLCPTSALVPASACLFRPSCINST